MANGLLAAGVAEGLNEGVSNFLNIYTRMKDMKRQEEQDRQNGLLRDLQMEEFKKKQSESEFNRAKDIYTSRLSAYKEALDPGELDDEKKQLLTAQGFSPSFTRTPGMDSDKVLDRRKKQLEISKLEREAGEKGTPAGLLKELSGEAKTKVGSIASTIQSVDELNKLYGEGQKRSYLNTSAPLIGGAMSDTPVDATIRKLSDDIGRLRSGGAINKDEEGRFLSMLPRASDNKEIALQKLAQVRQEMGTRLGAYGLKEEDLKQTGLLQPEGTFTQKKALPPSTEIPVGFVRGDYEYVGGDPKQKSSWKQVPKTVGKR